jgi:hypothetical protein
MADRLFDEEDLLDAARAETGLDDFGPPHFREGMSVLIESLTNDARLKADVVPRARATIHGRLTTRLRVQDWLNGHPEVYEERIEAPVCILGSPRSGSSIMHELWSLDPTTRNPLAWEVRNPIPPPETATYNTDPRIAALAAQMGGVPEAAADGSPAVPHRSGAQLPSEDVEITMLDFASVIPMVTFYVPTYTKWLFEEVDYAPVYGTLSTFLKMLQSRCPGSPWVLKSLYSMHYMDAFLAEYPDVRVIWLHRDPLTATASGVHLVQMAAGGSSDEVDRVDLARDVAHWSVVRHDLSVDVQEKAMVPEDRLYNVHYDEFVADHAGTVKKIYEHFGMELRPEIEQAMRDYVAANPAESLGGRHEYTFADSGLDPAEYRERFARYQAYFDVPNDPGT